MVCMKHRRAGGVREDGMTQLLEMAWNMFRVHACVCPTVSHDWHAHTCSQRQPKRPAPTGLAAPDADASSSASSSAAAAEAAAAAGRAAADAECYGAYLALEHWFRRCWERQAQPAAALASCLATDIRWVLGVGAGGCCVGSAERESE